MSEVQPLVLVVDPGCCGCGCGAPVRSKYKPGHDSKLKGALARAARDQVEVVVNGEHLDPLVYAERLGWLALVEKKTKIRPAQPAKSKTGRDWSEFLPPATPERQLRHPSGWCMDAGGYHQNCPRFFRHGICMCPCHDTPSSGGAQ
jgi:hypothetical protein